MFGDLYFLIPRLINRVFGSVVALLSSISKARLALSQELDKWVPPLPSHQFQLGTRRA